MQQDMELQKGTSSESRDQDGSKDNDLGKVREGQEDSSILHDKEDPDRELTGVNKDISSTSQEEFIDDDANTKKESDSQHEA